MSSSVPESAFELGIEFSEANNVLLMSLMEEIQEDHEYNGDERLVSMIQSLEAEISSPQMYEDNQDYCSTLIIDIDHWVDVELTSFSPFDEMNAWIPCGDDEMMEQVAMEYEAENMIDEFQMCCGVFLEQQQQQHRETYLSQGPSDAVF